MSSHSIAISAMTQADDELLGNLMELYVHDLSAIFLQVELGANGRFGYPHLSSYLSGSGSRFAFLVRCDGRVAGFVLAKRGSPVTDDPDVLDVAEFFVLRRFRGCGVGRAAARLLWDLMPGKWTIRASVRNPDAVAFWRRVAANYTGNAAAECERLVGQDAWVVFSFDNSE
jgi:predicted acetyltransferase